MAENKQRSDDTLPGETSGGEPALAGQPSIAADAARGGVPAETPAPADDAAASPTGSPADGRTGGDDAETRTLDDATDRAAHPEPPVGRGSREARAVRGRTPWAAMFASGLLGGAVVALAAGYVWSTYLADEGITNVLWARLGAVELAVQDLNIRGPQANADGPSTDELAARLAKVEAAVTVSQNSAGSAAPPGGTQSLIDTDLTRRLVGIETIVKTLAEGLARLDGREDETNAAVKELRERAAAAASSAAPAEAGVGKAEFEALDQRVAALHQSAASLQQSIERTTDSLQQTAARGAQTAAADRAVRLAVVATGLRSAVERGAPFGGELKAAKALMPDPQALGPLEPFAASGAPAAEALGRELAALAPQLARTGAASRDGGYLDRLQAHAERLVRVRPVNDASGDDVTAVVARIEGKAKQSDIAAALAELRKLPEPARAPAQAWIKMAEEREAAVAAAQRIEAAALTALANP